MPSRVIRGEINRSESLSAVSIEAELTFRALLMAADDYGRFDARPAILKAELFPMRASATPSKVLGWIQELAALADPPVILYESDGRPYLYMPSWERHRGGGKRGAASRYPAPPQEILGSPRKSADPLPSSVLRVASSGSRVADQSAETPAPPATTAKATGLYAPLTETQWVELRAWAASAVKAGKLSAQAADPKWLSDQIERCEDHWAAKGKQIKRWPAAVRNWLRKAEEFRARDAPTHPQTNGANAKLQPPAVAWLTQEQKRILEGCGSWNEEQALAEYESFREAASQRGLTFSATSGISSAIESRIRELRA